MCVDEILQRMRELFQVRSNRELCQLLNIKPQTMSGWGTRNVIPIELLLDVAEKKAVSLDWLIKGIEPVPELSTHEKMALIAFNRLSDEQKIDALLMMKQLLKSEPTQYIHQQGLTNLVTGDVKIG